MTLDGETIASVPRRVHYPQAIALALLNIDAAPGHLGPPDVAPGAVDETRVGNTFVGTHIGGTEIRGGGLERTNSKR
jgi:hypothetical protein